MAFDKKNEKCIIQMVTLDVIDQGNSEERHLKYLVHRGLEPRRFEWKTFVMDKSSGLLLDSLFSKKSYTIVIASRF
jgi:hypothetical protein